MLNQNFMIRRMTGQDLDALMVIEQDVFSLPWSRKSYESELTNQWATYYICDVEGELAAYCGMWVVFDEAHITNVAVARSYRKQGMALALLEVMEKTARQKGARYISLEVRPSNSSALGLYKGFGFEQTSVRKGYYQDNQEDALIMTKMLV